MCSMNTETIADSPPHTHTHVHTPSYTSTHTPRAGTRLSGTKNDSRTDPSPQASCARAGLWIRAELRSIQSPLIWPEQGRSPDGSTQAKTALRVGSAPWEAGSLKLNMSVADTVRAPSNP